MFFQQFSLATILLIHHAVRINSEQVQQGSMVIIVIHDILYRLMPKFIRITVGTTLLESAAGNPHAKSIRVVITPDLTGSGIVLNNWQATHLTAPVNHG